MTKNREKPNLKGSRTIVLSDNLKLFEKIKGLTTICGKTAGRFARLCSINESHLSRYTSGKANLSDDQFYAVIKNLNLKPIEVKLLQLQRVEESSQIAPRVQEAQEDRVELSKQLNQLIVSSSG